jgi:drug/metabolite transporter (DMT)-like permease
MGWFRNLGRDKPWAQGCVIFGSGVVLAVSGCFGFLLTLSFTASATRTPQEALGIVGALVFIVGCLATLAGFVWWIVGLGKVGARTVAPPQSPRPPAPPVPPPPPGPEG